MLKTTMTGSRKYVSFVLILISTLAISCSEMNPVSSTASEPSEVALGAQHIPFDLVNLQLPEGYRVLRSSSSLDECDSVSVSQLCRRLLPLNLLSILNLTSLHVQGSDLPHNQTITMVMPNTCEAVVDLYPHPFQFNGTVELRWLLPQVRYGQLLNPDDIAAFYVHDDGTCELADQSWGPLNLYLTVRTNHFSRYIIASRNNN